MSVPSSASESCIFCNIATGSIPSEQIYRDAEALVIRDVNPMAPQHLLVMPVEHHANLGEFTRNAKPEVVAKLFALAAKFGAENGPAGFRVVVNSGSDGGQTVDHLHLHVLAGRPLHWPPG